MCLYVCACVCVCERLCLYVCACWFDVMFICHHVSVLLGLEMQPRCVGMVSYSHDIILDCMSSVQMDFRFLTHEFLIAFCLVMFDILQLRRILTCVFALHISSLVISIAVRMTLTSWSNIAIRFVLNNKVFFLFAFLKFWPLLCDNIQLHFFVCVSLIVVVPFLHSKTSSTWLDNCWSVRHTNKRWNPCEYFCFLWSECVDVILKWCGRGNGCISFAFINISLPSPDT